MRKKIKVEKDTFWEKIENLPTPEFRKAMKTIRGIWSKAEVPKNVFIVGDEDDVKRVVSGWSKKK